MEPHKKSHWKPGNHPLKFNIFRLVQCFVFIGILGFLSCYRQKNSDNVIALDSRYGQIQKISTAANCTGPFGQFTTQVISNNDGSLLFSQTFDNPDSPFTARVVSDNEAYVIDEKENILDTLESATIEMLRSHDIHRIQTRPEHFFNHLKFEKNTDEYMELYTGTDGLNNPVKIHFNRDLAQIKKVELLNMMDTTEVIEIIYKNWGDSEYGKLVQEVEIIQAARDTFYYHFEKIEINQ